MNEIQRPNEPLWGPTASIADLADYVKCPPRHRTWRIHSFRIDKNVNFHRPISLDSGQRQTRKSEGNWSQGCKESIMIIKAATKVESSRWKQIFPINNRQTRYLELFIRHQLWKIIAEIRNVLDDSRLHHWIGHSVLYSISFGSVTIGWTVWP